MNSDWHRISRGTLTNINVSRGISTNICVGRHWSLRAPHHSKNMSINLYLNNKLFLVYLYVKKLLTSLLLFTPVKHSHEFSHLQPQTKGHNNVFLKSKSHIQNSRCAMLANKPCAPKRPSQNVAAHSANTQARNNSIDRYAIRKKQNDNQPHPARHA